MRGTLHTGVLVLPGTSNTADDALPQEKVCLGVVVLHVWFDDSSNRVNANVVIVVSWFFSFRPPSTIVIFVIFSCWLPFSSYIMAQSLSGEKESYRGFCILVSSPPAQTKNYLYRSPWPIMSEG